jgi:AraC-like DNA-binding protein
LAINRLARRRLTGFYGQCHLGLTDIVEPLVFQQRCLGVFYFGSVIVEGTEREARRRIMTYCRRRKLDPAPYLYSLKTATRIKANEVPVYQEQLRTLAALTINILDAYGLPLERYRTEMGPQFVASHRLPILIQGAMRYVHRNYREAIQLSDVAANLKCNPNYLSRTLNRHLKMGFSEYVLRVRIDHARSLLQNAAYGAGEVGFQVGFSDQSYFGKVFKQKTGFTPKEYQDTDRRSRLEKRPDLSKFGTYNLSRLKDI